MKTTTLMDRLITGGLLASVGLVAIFWMCNMAQINNRIDRETEQCFIMKGIYDSKGKCWIEKDGERVIVDLREGK